MTTDPFSAQAILDLLLYFGWSHFALVTAGDDLACMEITYDFLEAMNSHDLYQERLCMADRVMMYHSTNDARRVYRLLSSLPRAKVVVLLAPSSHIELLMNIILQESEKENTTFARVWIGYYRWGRAEDFVFSHAQFRRIMQGVVVTRLGHYQPFITPTNRMIRQYSDHVLSMTAGMLRREAAGSQMPPWWCRLIESQPVHGCVHQLVDTIHTILPRQCQDL